MTPRNNHEYWTVKQIDAATALETTTKRLDLIQNVGQLALWQEAKIIPFPLRNFNEDAA